MVSIDSVTPQFSATRAGGEDVTITGSGLDAVTAVSFGPFEATIADRANDRLSVRAPEYQPGHGGQHGELLLWVDTEPTHSGVVWTWEGRSLEQLGGPLDAADQALAFGLAPDPVGDPADPVDAALRPAAPDAAVGAVPRHAEVIGFEPPGVPHSGGWITIHGRRFVGATAVSIGSVPCSAFEIRADDTIVAFVPRFPGGQDEYPSFPIVWHGEQASLSPPGAAALFWDLGNGLHTTYAPPDELP